MQSGPTRSESPRDVALATAEQNSPAASSSPPEPTRARRILVIEDHPFMRRNIVAALEREPDFVVCGECDDVPEALVAIESLHPDVVLTDITLKSSNGLDLIRALRQRHPGVPSVATTMFDVHANERLALAAGACRFVSKHWGPESLVRAVRAALLETTKLSPAEG